jgi:nitrate/nitrite-specific signal transduction histidine kinase
MKRERFSKSLKFKVTIGMVVPVILIAGLFSVLMLLQRRQAMSNDLERSATQVGEVIESSLIRAMMTRDLESMQDTMDEIAATQEDIGELMLIDKRGEIIISSEGRRAGEVLELSDPTCQICHREQIVNRSQSVVFTDEMGEGFLRNVNPIANEEQCHACHDPEDALTGILITDLSMSRMDALLATDLRDNLLLSSGMVLGVVLTINFMISNTVVNKIESMVNTIRRFAQGDLDQRASIESNDELGELAAAFNDMAEGLKEKAKLEREVHRRTEELQKQTQRLLTLNAVAAAVSRSLDVEEMLETGLKKVLDLLGLDAGAIWLLNGVQDTLMLQTHSGQTAEFMKEDLRVGIGECLCGLVAHSGQAVMSTDIGSDQRLTRPACREGGYNSAVVVPLTSRDKALGVLTLHHREANHFQKEDLELLDAIGKQLGVALENAQLYGAMEKEVEERTRHLELGYDIAQAISSQLHVEPLLQEIVSETTEAAGAHAGVVMTAVQPDGLPRQAIYGSPSSGLTQAVSGLLYKEEYAQDGNLLVTPISSHGKIIGALGLEGEEGHRPFTKEDAQLLRGVAAQAAIAIENAMLYGEVQEVAILEERERLAREMHDGLAQTLGYIRLRMKIADGHLSQGEVDEAKQILEEITRTTEEAYLDAREAIADLRSAVFEGADFVNTLESYLEEFGLQNRIETRLTLEGEGGIEPSTFQAVQLIRIVQEALSNVRKYSGATAVSVRLANEGRLVTMVIEDNGRGFDVDEVRGRKGHHFGLRVMRERAESLKGTLEIHSIPGGGTRVVARIPLALEEERR